MKNVVHFKTFFVLFFLILLNGCAFFWNSNPIAAPKSYSYMSPVITRNFNYKGRFVVTNRHEVYYGNFVWIKDSDKQDLELQSILGNTIAKININKQYITISLHNKIYKQQIQKLNNNYYDNAISQLMKQNLGFEIPIQYMYYWVEGVPLPQYHIEQYMNNGFCQQGWKIEYEQYTATKPVIIRMSKENLRIKLLIL